MINSISSSQTSYLNSSSSNNNSNSLSFQQHGLIDSVLLNYDANSLTSQDAQEITQAFSDAGIRPTKELAQTMQSLGFDAKEVGSLARTGENRPPMPPPPPPKSDDSDSQISDTLLSLFDEDEDEESTTSLSFDDIMDYTSKILNLNESAKSDVLNMFETYSDETSELSKDDIRKVVSNGLNQILSDENNYNKTSFYA